jgi:ribosome biogenesis GTPase
VGASLTEGAIVKALAGFYYVETAFGLRMCRARGIFKKEGVTPLVGDLALISIQDEEDGVVERILPRRNSFIRPPVANIDCFVAVTTARKPSPNFEILDRFLVSAEMASVEIIVCINKIDLVEAEMDDQAVAEMKRIYAPLYPTVFVSAKTGEGIEQVEALLAGKRAAFAGPSGVGKSSLLNRFLETNRDLSEMVETGDISEKTGRGRHTTRHVEIYRTYFGGEIVDTPGYTAFESQRSDPAAIAQCFPDIALYADCRFDNCRHLEEPGCGVSVALKQGKIERSRYASYARIVMESLSPARKGI